MCQRKPSFIILVIEGRKLISKANQIECTRIVIVSWLLNSVAGKNLKGIHPNKGMLLSGITLQLFLQILAIMRVAAQIEQCCPNQCRRHHLYQSRSEVRSSPKVATILNDHHLLHLLMTLRIIVTIVTLRRTTIYYKRV